MGSKFQLSVKEVRTCPTRTVLRSVEMHSAQHAQRLPSPAQANAEGVFFSCPSFSRPLPLKRKHCNFENGTYSKNSVNISTLASGFTHYIRKHVFHGMKADIDRKVNTHIHTQF